MESFYRQHPANDLDLVDQIAQHLRQYPYEIRHARKLMRRFHALASDVAQALHRVAVPFTLSINLKDTGDQVLLHFLRYPGDVIDMRRVMHELHASESDVQRALAKLETYIVDGGEVVIDENSNKK